MIRTVCAVSGKFQLSGSIPVLAAMAITLLLSGCATLPADPAERAEVKALNDPIEPFNRKVLEANRAADGALLTPVTRAYTKAAPKPVQGAVHNAVKNLRAPWTFANDLMQGHPKAAVGTLTRFMINTTVGLGGLIDVADGKVKYPEHESGFGQTLAVWGVPEGPYLVLPFFGPSSLRDAGGLAVDFVGDPVDLALESTGLGVVAWPRAGVEELDDRSLLLAPMTDLEASSLDYYASLRSVYRQNRDADIANRKADEKSALGPRWKQLRK
jgi:phospholipid-binding lipoprotein MlaA